MKFLFLAMIFGSLLFFIWLNTEQSKGAENHDSYKMQLEQRARVIKKGGIYYE